MRFKQTCIAVSVLFFFFGAAFAQDVDSIKKEIYSKLHCCSCKETFAQCVCKDAKAMKAYIDALLETGVGKEEIYYKVAKKYSLNTITDPQTKAGIEKRLIDEAGVKRSQLVLEPYSFDFGKLRKTQGKVKKVFKVYNKGNADLIINNIKTSCGCVIAFLKVGENKSPLFDTAGAAAGWQAVIEAGKSGEIEINIDLKHSSVKTGRLIRELSIFSNDPLYPETILIFKADVE